MHEHCKTTKDAYESCLAHKLALGWGLSDAKLAMHSMQDSKAVGSLQEAIGNGWNGSLPGAYQSSYSCADTPQ